MPRSHSGLWQEAHVASWQREPDRLSKKWTAFRQAGHTYPALWHPGSRYQPTPQSSGRWHVEGVGYAQYFALEPDGAWAELVRYEGIRHEEERVQYRHKLWICAVTETEIADLSDFDTIASCGMDPEVFLGPHEPCQALADELLGAGFRGLVTPSAAISGVENLTLFGGRRELVDRSLWDDNPRPDYFIPVAVAAEGPPPSHILDLARLWGDPHLGYEEWKGEA